MIATALLAVPMAFLWMVVSGSVSAESFFVGYVLGFAIVFMSKTESIQVDRRRLPSQIAASVVYFVTLARDIWLSSVDVAKRVLDPDLPLNPGVIAVPTQDDSESDFIAAMSAHGITITPGELVLDFDGSHTMYVHCLDVESSGKSAYKAQTKRLHLLRRMVGRG